MSVKTPRSSGSLVEFGSDVTYDRERIWYLDHVRPFLESPDSDGPWVIARAFTGVGRPDERRVLERLGLSYSILEVSSGVVGSEWPSFPGHVHRGPQRTPFPSVLEVLHGLAAVLLQKTGSFNQVHEASLVFVNEAQSILLPPGFMHVVMNVGAKPLVVAVAHSQETMAEFEDVARHRGAGYYVGPTGSKANPHYRSHATLRVVACDDLAVPGLGGGLYQSLVESPERFYFLHPF